MTVSVLLREIFSADFIESLNRDRSEVHQFLHAVFVDTADRDEWAEKHRKHLGRLLEVAHRHGQLDGNTRRRLTSPDPVQFWGKRNELLIADYLESRSIGVEFNPAGRKNREGEFLITLDRPVFIEVKTMFPRIGDRVERRCLDKLCREAELVNYPAWLNIQLRTAPTRDFRRGAFRRFVEKEIPRLAAARQENNPSVLYRDEDCGLEAAIIYMTPLQQGPVVASPFFGVRQLTNEEYILASLEKAASQLPSDVPGTVVIFSRLPFGPTAPSILNALYGTFGVSIGHGPEPTVTQIRQQDGFFSACRHARVSAVAFVDELREKHNPYPELVTYHHPCPARRIEPDVLLKVSDRQLDVKVTVTDGQRSLSTSEPYRTVDD